MAPLITWRVRGIFALLWPLTVVASATPIPNIWKDDRLLIILATQNVWFLVWSALFIVYPCWWSCKHWVTIREGLIWVHMVFGACYMTSHDDHCSQMTNQLWCHSKSYAKCSWTKWIPTRFNILNLFCGLWKYHNNITYLSELSKTCAINSITMIIIKPKHYKHTSHGQLPRFITNLTYITETSTNLSSW